jgi:hypothetical protein
MQLLGIWYSVSYEKTKRNTNAIQREFGSTWGDNFYMGMQNGSKLEI